MSAERVPEQRRELRLAGEERADAIGVWLDLLVKLLRLPARECEAIRDELESHLRERVRDLVVAGTTEDDAVRVAVGELGDAASLAARYREARAYPRRRLKWRIESKVWTLLRSRHCSRSAMRSWGSGRRGE